MNYFSSLHFNSKGLGYRVHFKDMAEKTEGEYEGKGQTTEPWGPCPLILSLWQEGHEL